jgi:glycosyltransferase involved in cell wall biosynthesis
MHAKVTFVVPTRNSARTIGRCIDALQRQTGDVEIIVVDNGSTDATRTIVRQRGVRLETGGKERSAQRNRGLQLASGAITCFVDSDQIAEPDVSKELIDAFGRQPEVGAVVIPERSFGVGYFAKSRDLERRLIEGDAHAEAARAFRTADIRVIGGYCESLSAFEDAELPDRLMSQGWGLGRIGSRLWHDEGRIQLFRVLRKKIYYGRYLRSYATSAGVVRTTFRAVRPSYLQPGLLASDLTHVPGLILLKTVDVVGLLLGYASSLIDRRGVR